MRLIILGLLSFWFTTSATAQLAPDELEQEMRSAYENARLYLEMREVTRAGVVTNNGIAIPYSNTSRSWHAYQGLDRISEVRFFEVAGREDLAARARSRRSTGTTLVVVGTIASAVGLAILTNVALKSSSSDPFAEPVNVTGGTILGSAVAVGGSIPLAIGATKLRGNSVHAGIAAETADRYNEQLVERLLNTVPETPVYSDTAP